MKELQRAVFYIFFSLEIVLFIFFYIFGTHGTRALYYLQEKNVVLRNENESIKAEILKLEYICGTDACSSFYKEKIARERLQMARSDDIIYYLDT